MADIDKLLTDIALEEEKHEEQDWYCEDCEHGPMTESDDKCTRCGAKNSQYHGEDEITGWEEEDEMEGIEEIW